MNATTANGNDFNVTDDNLVTSSNESEAEDFALTTNFANTPMAVMLSVSAIFINGLVILCIVREKKLRRPANFYMLSLSFNEIIEALIPVNGLMVYAMFGDGWPLGLVTCKVIT